MCWATTSTWYAWLNWHNGHDRTLELEDAELAAATQLRYSADAAELAACNVFIVTVLTPIDAWEQPDLSAARRQPLDCRCAQAR